MNSIKYGARGVERKGKMYKGKKNFRQLKKNVMYIAKCYRTNIDRLLLDGYDNHKVDYVKQTHSDLEMVGYLNFVLELCSKESNLFLRAVYFDQNDNKLYFESLSRSSYYRLDRKAIYEIADCLNL